MQPLQSHFPIVTYQTTFLRRSGTADLTKPEAFLGALKNHSLEAVINAAIKGLEGLIPAASRGELRGKQIEHLFAIRKAVVKAYIDSNRELIELETVHKAAVILFKLNEEGIEAYGVRIATIKEESELKVKNEEETKDAAGGITPLAFPPKSLPLLKSAEFELTGKGYLSHDEQPLFDRVSSNQTSFNEFCKFVKKRYGHGVYVITKQPNSEFETGVNFLITQLTKTKKDSIKEVVINYHEDGLWRTNQGVINLDAFLEDCGTPLNFTLAHRDCAEALNAGADKILHQWGYDPRFDRAIEYLAGSFSRSLDTPFSLEEASDEFAKGLFMKSNEKSFIITKSFSPPPLPFKKYFKVQIFLQNILFHKEVSLEDTSMTICEDAICTREHVSSLAQRSETIFMYENKWYKLEGNEHEQIASLDDYFKDLGTPLFLDTLHLLDHPT